MASGLTGEPVPYGIGSGATDNMNSQRFRVGGRLADGFQIGSIDQHDPEHRQRKIVQRQARQITGRLRHVPGRLPGDERDVALLQPRDDGVVEPGGAFVDRPRSELRAARPSPPAEEQRVAGTDLHAGLLFPRFQVLGENRVPGSRYGKPFNLGMSNRIGAGHDPVLHIQDRVADGALFLRDDGVDAGSRSRRGR